MQVSTVLLVCAILYMNVQHASLHVHACTKEYVGAYSCHGDDGPPEALGDRVELVARVELQALSVVNERREDHNADDQEEHEEHQLLRGRPERVDQNLQAYAHTSYLLNCTAHVCVRV